MYIDIKDSPIHGKGVFAALSIDKGDWQHVYGFKADRFDKFTFEDKFKPYPPFKYLNHSALPNCQVMEDDDGVYIEALQNLSAGDELTIDYGEEP